MAARFASLPVGTGFKRVDYILEDIVMTQRIYNDAVIVRGGGDLATGVIQKFYRAGVKVLVLEVPRPTAIRRTVALCEAVANGVSHVEDMTACLIKAPGDCEKIWDKGEIPVLIDPTGESIKTVKPIGVVDAILAKKNFGTTASLAPIVLALGPGFSAPEDAHAVIETMRGHTLGALIFAGAALPDTGTPGLIAGRAVERVLRAPCNGVVEALRKIGDIVSEGDAVFKVGKNTVTAPFNGVLRGLIANGMYVTRGFKAADIDPRFDTDCYTITDKARCIGGAALEGYLYFRKNL